VTRRSVDGKALLEEALANSGRVPLANLLTAVVPVGKLRELAKAFGLTPKGGYRIDRAPGYILAPLVTDTDQPKVMEAACALLADHLTPAKTSKTKAKPKAKGKSKRADPALERKERELGEMQEELQKAREVANRQRKRLEELDRQKQQDKEQIARLTGEVDQLRRQLRDQHSTPTAVRDQTVEIHELLRELEELTQVETGQRRLVAERQARIRELEERVAELEPLVPKGRRRKKEPPAEPPPLPERFRRPYFTPSFYKSLENKDRRAIEAAYQAILLFCTEGPGYPGLQVKQLDAPVWSLRAALKLRVYFTNRADGDVDVLELADRQEQPTVLRKLREKQ
jgi:hypothetical protein